MQAVVGDQIEIQVPNEKVLPFILFYFIFVGGIVCILFPYLSFLLFFALYLK